MTSLHEKELVHIASKNLLRVGWTKLLPEYLEDTMGLDTRLRVIILLIAATLMYWRPHVGLE